MVFGKADTVPVELADVAAGTGGFVINGIDPSDYSGVSVSGAGDVNGDDLADLIVGARRGDPGGSAIAAVLAASVAAAASAKPRSATTRAR